MTDKVLGHATAYGYYKAGGGTMTEAEFTEFMADFGTASQTAVEAAQAALASETAARTAATTATNKASEATTAATTATTKAGEASTSASTATSAKDTAVSASQTATTKATEATTAAATATSAKTDAVAANTAAQSAKTAAQTAQTGAETAAASVQSSAAQIATNTEDISQLKSDINYIEDALKTEDSPELVDVDFTTSSGFIGVYGDVQADSSSIYTKIPVTAGEKYYVSCCLQGNRAIAFYNGSSLISSKTATSLGQGVLNDYEFTMPENCTVFGVTTYLPSTYPLIIKHYANVLITTKQIYNNIDSLSRIYESTNFLNVDEVEEGHYYNLSGARSSSSGMASTPFIPVEEGKKVVFGNDNGLGQARYVTAYDSTKNAVSASGGEYITQGYTVPSGIAFVRISATNKAYLLADNPRLNIVDPSYSLLPYEPYGLIYEPKDHQTVLALEEDASHVISENVLNHDTLTLGKYINTSGTMGDGSTYAVTDFIEVFEGAVVKGASGVNGLEFRFITAYNGNKNVLSSSGADSVSSYTVPSGVKYVRITGYIRSDGAGIDSTIAWLSLSVPNLKYQKYKDASVYDYAKKNYTFSQDITNYPLTSLNPYILKSLAYKPLGTLEKGYICLVSDDGNIDLANYAIPMLISKGVPCTFALMSTSQVMNDLTAKAVVLDAVNNHGCKVAQHGDLMWSTAYDEFTLNRYFDAQEEYFADNGITITSGVCPAHGINDMVKAVAGGRWGVCRTGYSTSGATEYDNMCGARSNIYALPAQNTIEYDLDYWKDKIDLAIANHYILIPFWHENELTSEQKTKLEAIIDYAKAQNMTFVTLDEIPLLR